jgi:hypothetical protein
MSIKLRARSSSKGRYHKKCTNRVGTFKNLFSGTRRQVQVYSKAS